MNDYENKFKKYIEENNIPAEYLNFEQSCHSVAEAAQAAHVNADDFVKNICLIDSDDRLIVAIVKGEDKVSITKIRDILNIKKPRPATPTEILEKTGYPCGGTPSFGYSATFLIDTRVLKKETIFSGGGTENSLLKISTVELVKANGGKVVDIKK